MDHGAQGINFTELFAELIDSKGELNDSISTFLYYMFPRDLFIRALSLLESNDMMIYAFDNNEESNLSTHNSTSTETAGSVDTSIHITNTINDNSPKKKSLNNDITDYEESGNKYKNETFEKLLRNVYDDDYQLLYRLIVKSSEESTLPVYVDLKNWTCSCNEFCELFEKEINSQPDKSIEDLLLNDIDDIDKFNDDKFGQLDAFSFSKQRYFKFDKVICPHLLAYSILLESSLSIVQHFVITKSNVLLIRINNIDEWLKLHINIVI